MFRTQWPYRVLGIHVLGRVIGSMGVNLNPHLRGLKNWRYESLLAVRSAMTSAEIGHWIGFVAMGLCIMVVWATERSWLLLTSNLIVNILGNAYLSLLQQYNKLRIDRIVSRAKVAGHSV